MERTVGEIFNFLGHTLRVKKSESGTCFGCFFFEHGFSCYLEQIEDVKGVCIDSYRSDGNHVIFKEQ